MKWLWHGNFPLGSHCCFSALSHFLKEIDFFLNSISLGFTRYSRLPEPWPMTVHDHQFSLRGRSLPTVPNCLTEMLGCLRQLSPSWENCEELNGLCLLPGGHPSNHMIHIKLCLIVAYWISSHWFEVNCFYRVIKWNWNKVKIYYGAMRELRDMAKFYWCSDILN